MPDGTGYSIEKERTDAMKTQLQTMSPGGLAKAPPKIWRTHPAAAKVATAATLALIAGLVIKTPTDENALAFDEMPTTYITAEVAQDSTDTPEDTLHVIIEAEPVGLLESVALDYSIQKDIWEICKEDTRLFCMVMAIANKETRFDIYAIGDHGNSLGLMQVQPRWHQERMDRLEVTDLKDPVQCTTVAVDYIYWIAERLTPEAPEDAYGTHALLMAYNQGWSGANNCWKKGIHSTEYSREVMGYYLDYMAEMEAAE